MDKIISEDLYIQNRRIVMCMSNWPFKPDFSYLPENDDKYWNKKMETMPREERKEIILEDLKKQVEYAYKNSQFYREFYKDAPVDPTNISSFEEFEKLPVLKKEDISKEQAKHPPFGRHLCIDEKDIFRILGTAGTTGRPTVFGISEGDWKRIGEWHGRILWSLGLRPEDRVIVTSPFTQYWGSWGSLVGLERIGCSVFPFGAGIKGQTSRAVEWVKMLQPDALYATPSYAIHLGEKAQEKGYETREDYSFDLMFFSGEPGASVPSTKQRIEEMFGCEVVDQGSMGEVAPWMSNSGCIEMDRGMHLWEDIVYTELLDPETKEVVPFGEEGVPTYTHVSRTSQPMIRYWSGDISRWELEECECGRTYPTFPEGIYGRIDDMLVIKGENVYPTSIEESIRSIDELSDEYRAIVSREATLDELEIKAELKEGVPEEKAESVKKLISSNMRENAGLSPSSITLEKEGSLERTQFKADRIVDER